MKKHIYKVIVALLMLIPFIVSAQKIQTNKRVFHNDMDNNDYTETSSYYFDENDNKIMHGQCVTTCDVNNVYDAKNSYKITYKETKNYSHGTLDGAYSLSSKIERKDLVTISFRSKVVEKLIEKYEQGTYKNGKKDGLWTLKTRDKIWNSWGDEDKIVSKKITFKNGIVVGCDDENGKYHILFEQNLQITDLLSGTQGKILSGTYDKYKIKNNLVTNYNLRGDAEETVDEKTKKIINGLLEDGSGQANSEMQSVDSMMVYLINTLVVEKYRKNGKFTEDYVDKVDYGTYSDSREIACLKFNKLTPKEQYSYHH